MAEDDSNMSMETAVDADEDENVTVADSVALEADTEAEQLITNDADSAIGSIGSTWSSTQSFQEEMIRSRFEHGREYQGYMEAKYVLPMDKQETDRLDFQCHLVWLTLDKKLSFAPLGNLRRALDVGCGTGMWTIDFAEAHPESEVLGVDLAPVMAPGVPPNIRFEVDDLEQPWNFTRKFDYIHSQLMIGAFSDWPKFFRQGLEFLEDGGYLEVHDIDFVIRCDDGTLPADSSLARWHSLMHEAASKAGFPLEAISHVPGMMKAEGFHDVVAIPIKWPINPWPRDEKYKQLGWWVMENFVWGCESMSLALFTRALGWDADEVRVFMAQVRHDLRNPKIHAYWNFWVVYGRKKR